MTEQITRKALETKFTTNQFNNKLKNYFNQKMAKETKIFYIEFNGEIQDIDSFKTRKSRKSGYNS